MGASACAPVLAVCPAMRWSAALWENWHQSSLKDEAVASPTVSAVAPGAAASPIAASWRTHRKTWLRKLQQ